MRTRAHLEEMTDPAMFEELAVAVLRHADPACQTLIHSGVNAYGRTIKAPVDGIAWTRGAVDEELVLAAFTTIASSGDFDRKLLHPDDGDIAKAAKVAAELSVSDSCRLATCGRAFAGGAGGP